MGRLILLTLLGTIISLSRSGTAFTDPISEYFEGWDVGEDLQGWIANTTKSNVAVVDTGGNPGGFLFSSGNVSASFDIGAVSTLAEVTGNYSGTLWRVSFDLLFISGNFDNLWLRYRFRDSTQNGWLKSLTGSFPLGVWTSFTVTFDPAWSDSEAMAAGWVPDNAVSPTVQPSVSWSQTMSEVFTKEIRISGEGFLEAGIDNVRLTALDTTPLTFNPTAKVTLGGSQPGSAIEGGTMPQIVRTTTFFFNLRDDLPSSRTMSFDSGVLNMGTVAPGTRLFETNIVISATIFGAVTEAITARIGHAVVSSTQNSATLVGTIEAITIDPVTALLLGGDAIQDMQALIGSVGMNSSISANTEGFSYVDSFNVPSTTVSEDVQSFQIEAVVTDTFPADLYTTTQLDGTLTVSNDLTSLTGLTSDPIIDQFIISTVAPETTPPQTTLTGGPLGTITETSATFTFTGSDNITPIGNLVYASRLDSLEPSFSSFSSSTSRTFSNLALGDYTFHVKARDQAGNQDPSPATRSFSITGTILVANFMNGNNNVLHSRVYLWNSSLSAGNVTVRVFTLPLTGTSTLLGTVDLGLLEAESARNIKVAEGILLSLGIPLPYTDNGGNLTLEFAIEAENVRGAAQVFSSNLAFGTYPLQEIPSTPNASPTVLVANFTNGNNAFLNSRVYLWNPSESAGSITVQAYTLPGSGPSTLLGTAELGLLDARSSRNIKIAEDVLFALGIPLPYTDDGGNLTIEFTVAAENVRGVAQVFSSNLAFGTYPMQVIP